MARQFITPLYPNVGGVAAATSVAHIDGHAVPMNEGYTQLRIINGGGAPTILTFDIPRTIEGGAAPDPAISIPAGATRIFSGFRPAIYAQADGNLYFTFSVLTSVTIEATLPQRGV
jgi:hypothetical protein